MPIDNVGERIEAKTEGDALLHGADDDVRVRFRSSLLGDVKVARIQPRVRCLGGPDPAGADRDVATFGLAEERGQPGDGRQRARCRFQYGAVTRGRRLPV